MKKKILPVQNSDTSMMNVNVILEHHPVGITEDKLEEVGVTRNPTTQSSDVRTGDDVHEAHGLGDVIDVPSGGSIGHGFSRSGSSCVFFFDDRISDGTFGDGIGLTLELDIAGS